MEKNENPKNPLAKLEGENRSAYIKRLTESDLGLSTDSIMAAAFIEFGQPEDANRPDGDLDLRDVRSKIEMLDEQASKREGEVIE